MSSPIATLTIVQLSLSNTEEDLRVTQGSLYLLTPPSAVIMELEPTGL